jgi:hypothetical protein
MISLSAAEGEPFEGDSCNVVRIEASNDSSPVGIDGCVLVRSLPPRVFDCCEVELASGWTSFTVLEFVDSNGDFRAGSVAAYSADEARSVRQNFQWGVVMRLTRKLPHFQVLVHLPPHVALFLLCF